MKRTGNFYVEETGSCLKKEMNSYEGRKEGAHQYKRTGILCEENRLLIRSFFFFFLHM